MNWKVGDVAICIRAGGPSSDGNYAPLRVGGEYIVGKIHICECGMIDLDVGFYSPYGTECDCGACSSPKSGIWWQNANRFVKKKSLEEKIAEAMEQEDYETLEKLKHEAHFKTI